MLDNKKNGINMFKPSDRFPSNITSQYYYHYTSPEGLYGILFHRTLRFSDCQFLNDKSEYIYFKSPLREALEQVKGFVHGNPFQYVESHLSDDFDDMTFRVMQSKRKNGLAIQILSRRHYILCASSEPDSLNMWNYYTKGGNYQGYNLEINMREILNCFCNTNRSDIDLYCGRVIYNRDKQIKIFKELLMKTDEKLHQSRQKYEHLVGDNNIESMVIEQNKIIDELISELEIYRLFFKDVAFSNENEYRFVIRASIIYDKDPVLNPGFDVKNGIIKPHFELSFNGKQVFRSITLSPMLDRDLAETGLKEYLRSCGFGNSIKIRQSVIPVRF